MMSQRTRMFVTVAAMALMALLGGLATALFLTWSDAPESAESVAPEQETFAPAEVAEADEAPVKPAPEPAPEEEVAEEEAFEGDLSEEDLEFAYAIEELRDEYPSKEAVEQGQGARGRKKKPRTLKPSVLVVVTNFDKAEVEVNSLPYPEYFEKPEDEGMLLPAGGPYDVSVAYGDKTKNYTLSLRPYETRYLVVELSGFRGGGAAPARPSPSPRADADAEEEKEEQSGGRITIYSKPRGQILIDGEDQGERTPNTVDTSEGRHEVQVKYEGGEVSEKKIVRVRKGSRIKLFFRQPKK